MAKYFRNMLELIKQEVRPLVFIAGFSLAIGLLLSANRFLGIYCGLILCSAYIVAIIVHEYSHFLMSTLLGVPSRLRWQPRPTLACGQATDYKLACIALAGPLGATAFSLVVSYVLYAILKPPILMIALPLATAFVHFCMLLPLFPDGRYIKTLILRRLV